MCIIFVTVSCKREELYTIQECKNLKKGDTIFTHYLHSIEKEVVIKNYSNQELIEVKSLEYDWKTSVYIYNDFRFKD